MKIGNWNIHLVSYFTIKVNGIMEHKKDYMYYGGKLTQIQQN